MDIREIVGLWCDDITFCPATCGQKSCPRNKANIRDRRVPHSFSVEIPDDCLKKIETKREHISQTVRQHPTVNETLSEVTKMGCVRTITVYGFPKQSEYVNRRCKVCFHYDTTKWLMGTVIRDDSEEPFETLIHLDDGRTIRGTECQYSHLPD